MSAADARARREQFPTLRARTYFATQCLGPLPQAAFADLDAYRETLLVRNRGLATWIGRMEELHVLVEQLLSAPSGSVALMPSATAAQATLAATLEPTLRRNRVLISKLDFHSSRYLWAAQQRRGFQVTDLPAADDATLTAERVLAALDDRVAVVALALVSPRSGALLDLEPIVTAAHAVGARVIVDAYQAVGVVPIDVRRLGVDALIGGTHKWLCGGGTGLAFAYVHPAWSESVSPVYPGWLGHAELLGFEPDFRAHRGARRFEQGTPALEPIYTARAGLQFVLDVGVANIRARNLTLTARLREGCDRLGLPVRTPRADARRGGMLVVDLPGAERVVETLETRGIDVDHRPGAGMRVAPHYCNSEDECDRLIAALAETIR